MRMEGAVSRLGGEIEDTLEASRRSICKLPSDSKPSGGGGRSVRLACDGLNLRYENAGECRDQGGAESERARMFLLQLGPLE